MSICVLEIRYNPPDIAQEINLKKSSVQSKMHANTNPAPPAASLSVSPGLANGLAVPSPFDNIVYSQNNKSVITKRAGAGGLKPVFSVSKFYLAKFL